MPNRWLSELIVNVRVVEQDGADDEAPDQAASSRQPVPADQEAGDGQHDARHPVVAVEPAQFGVAGAVADVVPGRLVVVLGEDPADVRPPEAGDVRRVRIVGRVGVAVVVAVVRRPTTAAPSASALQPSQASTNWNDAARLVGAVGEVAVVAARDAEHADEVGSRSSSTRAERIDAGEEDGQAGQVQADERDRP